MHHFNCVGLKTGSVLTLDSTIKLLDFKYNTNSLKIKVNDELELKTSNTLSTATNCVYLIIADTRLSSSITGIQVSTYEPELQQINTDTQTYETQAETTKTEAQTRHKQRQQEYGNSSGRNSNTTSNNCKHKSNSNYTTNCGSIIG
jgi:hypothetical protein